MKVLMVSTPATGHLNPLLAIAHGLIEDGHKVELLSGSRLRPRIEAVGAGFRAFPAGADLDPEDIHAIAPELVTIAPGPEWLRIAISRIFVDPIPAQHAGLQHALREFEPDVVVGDDMVFGVLPMLLGPQGTRPPVVLCGTSVLHSTREDGAPHFLGLPPATTQEERDKYAVIAKDYDDVVNAPVRSRLKEVLSAFGVSPPEMALFDSVAVLADAYLQLTVPSFEFPRQLPPSVHFVGRPPIIPNQAPLPPWSDDIDGSRKVVLVTQGTVANHDFGLLVAPTLAALADEPDLLVVVTTGGRPVDSIPGAIPANARVARYLPFEWILPKTNVFVTNGGYGSVNQALSYGIPIVSAGLTEDKADVNARIAWSGVGIDLATNEPAPQALREAVRAVLDQPGYRKRAASIADEFTKRDTRSEIIRIIDEVASRRESRMQTSGATVSRRRASR
jgi:MGT family glycosyltransferase